MMLQVLRKGLSEVVVDSVPEPSIGLGEVKIKAAYSLISSGTEVAGLHPEGLVKEVIRDRNRIRTLIGRAIRNQGVVKTAQAVFEKFSELSITGYSGCGIVIEKSNDITDLDLGQKVAYGGVDTGHAEIVCAPRNLVAPVPKEVNLKDASLTTVGSIALHAIRNAHLTIGDTVAVIGLGLIGQLVVQLASLTGARVFGIDINKERIKQALDQGAEIALDTSGGTKERLLSLTNGHGVDAVIICASSKTAQPLEMAIDISRSRARVVVVGMIKMEVSWESVFLKELRLTVSRAYGPGSYDPMYEKKGIDYPIDYVRWTENRNMSEFLRLLSIGCIKPQHIVTHEFPFQDAPSAFKQLVSGEGKILGAILSYPELTAKESNRDTKISLATSPQKNTARQGLMRVGVIGLGNIARWVHLPNVKKHPKLILQGVCTPKGYKAKHFGTRFKSEYCTTDYRQIIEDPDIDLIIICTRNDLHASIAAEALEARKHVFLEKPMALTREDCSTLVQLVKETGMGLMVNFNRRYSPMYQKAKEAMSGKGPKIISIRMNSPDMTHSYWMTNPVEGGGAILGEGCHFFDLMAWLTESDPTSVFAYRLRLPQDDLTSKNNIACILSFEDGSIGNLIYETVGHKGLGSERVEISAGSVSAIIDDDIRRLTIWNGASSPSSRPKKKKSVRSQKGYYELLNAFIDGIQKGLNFEKDGIAGAGATLSALAALKSLETGQPEEVKIL